MGGCLLGVSGQSGTSICFRPPKVHINCAFLQSSTSWTPLSQRPRPSSLEGPQGLGSPSPFHLSHLYLRLGAPHGNLHRWPQLCFHRRTLPFSPYLLIFRMWCVEHPHHSPPLQAWPGGSCSFLILLQALGQQDCSLHDLQRLGEVGPGLQAQIWRLDAEIQTRDRDSSSPYSVFLRLMGGPTSRDGLCHFLQMPSC